MLSRRITELNGPQIVNLAYWLRLFNWGIHGQCLYDTCRSLACYLDGDKQKANELMSNWLAKNNLSSVLKMQISDTLLIGCLWTEDWTKIISEYELLKEKGLATPYQLNLYASRAYSELGQFKQAAQCFNEIKTVRSRSEIYSLSATLLAFYCLAGNSDQAKQLLTLMSKYKYNLPDYVKNYWLGRLALTQNDPKQAEIHFDAAAKAASKLPFWQKRINDKRNLINASTPHETPAVALEAVMHNLERAASTQELLSPQSGYCAVNIIIASIIIVFLFANSYSLLPSSITYAIEMSCYNYGILFPGKVLAGEYWRLFTFLFLHAHLMHAALNLIALFWLGKIVERIYGLSNFLLIYFLSGIISGIVSIAFAPDLPAIGASGAIMGVFGAVGTGIFRLKNVLPADIRRKQLTLMIGLLVFQLIIDQIIPHIDVGAHIGGLVSGIILGLMLPIPSISTTPTTIKSSRAGEAY